MTKDDAKKKLFDFLKDLRETRPLNFEPFKIFFEQANHDEVPFEDYRKLVDGSHLFILQRPAQQNPKLIVVKENGETYEIYGACAGVFFRDLAGNSNCKLGAPLTGERWIGSGLGRYQLFDYGLVKWEGATQEDIAHSVNYGKKDYASRKTDGFVAFVDIRGFTKWTQKNDASTQYRLIRKLEDSLQKHFSKANLRDLFIKGTGDGFMIIPDQYELHGANRPAGQVKVTADDFVKVCLGCCKEMAKILEEEDLSVGFGVDFGEINNVLILGRWDYIGAAVNNASKLQARANNEVVISEECYKKLTDVSIRGRCKINSYTLKY